MNSRTKLCASALYLLAALVLVLALGAIPPRAAHAATPDSSAPTTTVKLVFIHHSTGDAWLQDGYGRLAASLGANHYYVNDTNYGWGPSGIGDHTDIGDWWTWFRGPSAASSYLPALYANTTINSGYARSLANPGGENTVVMFKSCFPNSSVGGSAGDAIPAIGSNPLKGNGMSNLTVGNAKGVYLDLLEYFEAHPDKLFVLVVSPPLRAADTNSSDAANARVLANWLVAPDGLLKDYSAGNVFVFDYYTVLTGGHHRLIGGDIEHSAGPSNYLAFPTGDSHPSAAGDAVATAEFVPMLNAAYNSWRAGGSATLPPTLKRRAARLSKPSAGRTTLSHTKSYYWRGSVTPAQIGKSTVRVEVQRRVRGHWVKYATYTTTLKSGSTAWSLKLRVKKAGSFRIRSRHSDGDHYSAASVYRWFRVK
jgi:hypothetical protein